jgi:membrane protease YdiL (CAAX protease family)
MTMMLADAAVTAALQLVVLGVMPVLAFWLYHRVRHKRTFADVAARAGLQLGETRYLAHGIAMALSGVGVLLIWTPPLEPMTRQGSAQHQFVGLGLGLQSFALAFLHGVVQTGLSEELLFRGLIAGSLSRGLPFLWANLTQAAIFFLPHLAILFVAPEAAAILPLVFAGALVLGWLRIRSGSILGPWIVHASGNVTMALIVAART